MSVKAVVIALLVLSVYIVACSEEITIEPIINNTTAYEPENITEIYVPIPDKEVEINFTQDIPQNDTYEIVKNTNISCETHNDCVTPGEYLVLSHCPYSSRCINETCAVVCPEPFKSAKEEYANMKTISVKECSERGGTAINIVDDVTCKETETMLGKIEEFISPNICCAPRNIDLMPLSKARTIGEEACKEQGELTGEATYSADKKIWMFELNVEKKECYPVCYVFERTKKAEVGYICVGAIPQHEERFVSRDTDLCKTLQYTCDTNQEKFFSTEGCGCKTLPPKVKHFCKEKERKATCDTIQEETCGWFDQGLTCREPPCIQAYDNPCLACLNEKITYWTQGACPQK